MIDHEHEIARTVGDLIYFHSQGARAAAYRAGRREALGLPPAPDIGGPAVCWYAAAEEARQLLLEQLHQARTARRND